MIDFLLSAGADPDIPCIAALAMLDGSLSTFDEKHLAELMQDPHTDAAESIGWKSFAMLTPLQAAAIMGRFDLVWKFRQTSKTPTHSVPIFRRPEEILARHHRRIRSDITRWPVLDHALDSNPYYFGLEITESGFHGLAPQEYYRFIHRLLNSPETRNNYPEFCNEHVLFDDSKLYPREGLLCWSLLKYPISVRPGLKCSRTHSSQSKSALFR